MHPDLYSTYLLASPVLDPTYVELRKEVFGKNRNWIKIQSGLFDRQVVKMAGLQTQLLAPALGWEFAPAHGCPKPILNALFELKDWDVCQWNCLAPNEFELLKISALKLGLGIAEFPFPISVIVGTDGYKGYLNKRSSKMNKNQRSALRKAHEAHLTFKTELEWTDIERVLDSRAVSFVNGSDYTRSPEFREFFKTFREAMKREGRLIETGLYDGSKLVAFDIGFWIGTVFHSYQTAYDPRYAAFRAGNLTFEMTLERVLNRGATLVDFMGASPYFSNFTSENLPMKRAVLYSKSAKGELLSWLTRLRRLALPTQF